MISDAIRAKWKKRVDFLMKHQDYLSDWELEFLESVYDKVENDQELTMHQSKKLGEIYHKLESKIG